MFLDKLRDGIPLDHINIYYGPNDKSSTTKQDQSSTVTTNTTTSVGDIGLTGADFADVAESSIDGIVDISKNAAGIFEIISNTLEQGIESFESVALATINQNQVNFSEAQSTIKAQAAVSGNQPIERSQTPEIISSLTLPIILSVAGVGLAVFAFSRN